MQRFQTSFWAFSIASAIAGGFISSLEATAMPTPSHSNLETIERSLSLEEISDAVVTLEAVGGRGTGSIIKANGIVLTSEHIVTYAERGQVSVVTEDGRHYPGQVIAIDRNSDLALIKIFSRETFSTLSLASADALERGQTVYALDDPFSSLEDLTTGELTQVVEPTSIYTNLLLNPGDSGGPLLNSQGEIIGVNRAIIRFQSGEQPTTLGLATHIASVREFLQKTQPIEEASWEDIAERKKVELGVTVVPDTLEIIRVKPGSLAERWGLRPGDEIVGYNYRNLESLEPLREFLATHPSEVILFLRRNDYLVRVRRRL
jgi:serine protease Do